MPGFLGYEYYQLVEDGIDISYTPNGSDDAITFRGPWEGHIDFCKEVIGREESVIDGNVTTTYYKPAAHPYIPNCYARRCRVKNFGMPSDGGNGVAVWEEVLITVDFSTPEYQVEGETPYRAINFVSSNEFQTVEGFAWEFASGQEVQAPVPIEMRRVDFQVQCYRVPKIPYELFEGHGCVNDAAVTLEDIGTFPAGTLLLDSVSADINISTGFNKTYQSNYGMAYRRIPWNQELNPFTGAYEEITLKGDPAKKKYKAVDFNKFFNPINPVS